VSLFNGTNLSLLQMEIQAHFSWQLLGHYDDLPLPELSICSTVLDNALPYEMDWLVCIFATRNKIAKGGNCLGQAFGVS